MDGYQELAYAICRSACDDYVDALILKNRGWLSKPEELNKRKRRILKKLWRTVINYGDRRYIYRSKSDGRIVRQKEEKNILECEKISNLIYDYEEFGGPSKTIHDCEAFFRSNRFAIFMPEIDPEDLIKALREKANKGERTAQVGRGKENPYA